MGHHQLDALDEETAIGQKDKVSKVLIEVASEGVEIRIAYLLGRFPRTFSCW